MPIIKEDLVHGHYKWTDNFSFTGSPSRRRFDRSNGYQVLFIINFFGSLSEQFSIKEGRVMEEKIMWELPNDVKSEMSVFNWLRGIK